MLLLWQYAPLPRIHSATVMLRQHWSSELIDKQYRLTQNIAKTKSLYADALKNSAAMMVRRGDKGPEDSYHRLHGYFHDLSLYGYTLVKRQELTGTKFSSLFFMTEERGLLAEIQACAKSPKPPAPPNWENMNAPNSIAPINRPSGCRSQIAEWQFSGMPLTWNVYAPQACYDPFLRIGFEQFLVSLNVSSQEKHEEDADALLVCFASC